MDSSAVRTVIMGAKVFVSFPVLFFILSSILLSVLVPIECRPPTTTTLSANSSHDHLSAFGFFKNLEGSRRGNKVEGIHKVKSYLQHFGYMKIMKSSPSLEDDDHFDDALEASIKSFQTFYNLAPTGMLDSPTVNLMSQPRCGVPDILENANMNHTAMISHGHGHLSIGGHYAFFPNKPVWPAGRRHLRYLVEAGSHPDTPLAVSRGFSSWASVTKFTFESTADRNAADIWISFKVREHGDGLPFDGPHGITAHAFAPQAGMMHYDGDENWVYGIDPNGIDLQSVGTHEIGHLLGMAHSTDPSALMYAINPYGTVKGLNTDDIDGIHALYPDG